MNYLWTSRTTTPLPLSRDIGSTCMVNHPFRPISCPRALGPSLRHIEIYDRSSKPLVLQARDQDWSIEPSELPSGARLQTAPGRPRGGVGRSIGAVGAGGGGAKRNAEPRGTRMAPAARHAVRPRHAAPGLVVRGVGVVAPCPSRPLPVAGSRRSGATPGWIASLWRLLPSPSVIRSWTDLTSERR